MKLASLALVGVLGLPGAAVAQPMKSLKTTVITVAEPPVRVALAGSGSNAHARYDSPDPGWYPPGAPLVLLLRDSWSRTVQITRAELTGRDIEILVSTDRSAVGDLCMKCALPSATLAEIELGPLLVGEYRVVIRHTDVLHDEKQKAKTLDWVDRYSFRVMPPPPPTPTLP